MNEQDLGQNYPYRKGNRNSVLWTFLIVIMTFYVGVAWGKRDQSSVSSPSKEVSSFIKNLTDPNKLFAGDPEKEKPEQLDFDVFWEAWKEVDKKFVDESKLDSQDRVYGAVSGMISALDDPYSSFMTPQETIDFNQDMEGSFEGIGAELGIRDGILTVVAPIEGMPAEAAGLRAGDKIISIDGESSVELTIDEAVRLIRGEKGTTVILTVIREDVNNTIDIEIVRGKIEIKSVVYNKRDDGIAYLKVKKFAEDTTAEFEKAISLMIPDGTKGIVLDLRNNPGGYLSVAVDLSSKFISKGEPVVWEKERNGDRKSYKAVGGDTLANVPVVVLLNEGSASASEILAGALRDLKGSMIVGKKSFGKGSVQQVEGLKDGSSLRITVAKWLTPSGNSIHEIGLEPDIEVDLTLEDYENDRDPQLDKAMDEIRKIIKK